LKITDIESEHRKEVEKLKDEVFDLQKQLDLNTSEYDSNFEDLNAKISALMQENEELTTNQGSSSSRSLFEETDNKKDQVIRNLEAENQEIKDRFSKETEDHQIKTKQLLDDLSNTFGIEKQALESSLKEQKEKYIGQIDELLEEHEQALKEKENELDDLRYSWEEEHHDMENNLIQKMNEYKHKIQNYEEQLKDKNEQLSKVSAVSKEQFEKQIEKAHAEKQELQDKIVTLNNDVTAREVKLNSRTSDIERLKEDFNKKYAEVEEERINLDKEKEEFEQNVKDYKTEIDRQQKEIQKIKMDNDKQVSLLQQQLEFEVKNKESIKSTLEGDVEKLKKSKNSQKQNLDKEAKEKVINMQQQIDTLKSRLEEKSNELKEYQVSLGERNAQLEKENAVSARNYKFLEDKYEEEKSKHEAMVNGQSADLAKENEKLNSEKSKLIEKIDNYETELYDVKTGFEKQILLKDHQIEFQTQHYDTLKKEYKGDKERFQVTLERLSKRNGQKQSSDTGNEYFQSMQEIYNNQAKDLSEKHKVAISEKDTQLKELKEDNKALKEKFHQTSGELRNFGKKYDIDLKKYKDFEEKLRQENIKLRNDSEARICSLQESLEAERENSRKKYSEIEDDLKRKKMEVESLRIESHKLQSSHNTELRAEKDLHNDQIHKYEVLKKKNEVLKKDLEKYKNNSKHARRGVFGAERSSSNFAKNGLRPSYSKFPQTTSKGQSSTGSSMCGSQKENSSGFGKAFSSKYMENNLGKTTNFDQLSTNKPSAPLGRNPQQQNTTESQYESREDDEE